MVKTTVSLYAEQSDVDALDRVADERGITRSEAFRIVLRDFRLRHQCQRLVCDECGEVAYLTDPDDCPACGSREVSTDAL